MAHIIISVKSENLSVLRVKLKHMYEKNNIMKISKIFVPKVVNINNKKVKVLAPRNLDIPKKFRSVKIRKEDNGSVFLF